MSGRRSLALLLLLLVSLPASSLWKTIKTDAFKVFYPQGMEREAEEILAVMEHYREYVGDLIGKPPRRIAIVLEDIGTGSSGLTDAANRRILLFRSSPSEGSLGYHQNWWRLVGIHEYTHWAHLSTARGLPALLTALFGTAHAPGNRTPGWLKEGICVVAESEVSPYEGRLNEGMFDAYAAVLAQTEDLPSITQATYDTDTFPGDTGPFLFGGQFIEFLVKRYGKDTVTRFFTRYSSSILSCFFSAFPAAALDGTTRRIFGKPMRDLWFEWQQELTASSVNFKPAAHALTEHGWWLRCPVFWEGEVYYQRTFPVKPAASSTYWQHQLLKLDPGSGRSQLLFRSCAPFTGPMRIRGAKLYYALREVEGGYDNHLHNRLGFTSELHCMDLRTRSCQRLLKEPLRTFEVLTDGTVLTARDRQDEFGSEIRLHDPVSGVSRLLLVTDLLVSDMVADSRGVFVSARRNWDNARIYRVDIRGWSGAGRSLIDLSPADIRTEMLHDTPFQEAELCLAGQGLFYSATYGSKRGIYEYVAETGAVYRSVNSDFARAPAWDEGSGNLYFIGLNARGEDLYRAMPQHRQITVPTDGANPGVPSVVGLEIPADTIRRGGYWDNLATLLPNSRLLSAGLHIHQMIDYMVGAGVAGTSALGDFHYVLFGRYDSYLDLYEIEADLHTNVFAPLAADFGFSYLGEPISEELFELTLTLELPLYQSLGKGLSHISFGTTGILEWDSSGEQTRNLLPYAEVGFQSAASTAVLRTGVQLLHDVDAADFDTILLPDLSVSVIFIGVEFAMQASGLYGFSEGSFILPWAPIGYLDPLQGSWGGFFSSTLSIPLLRRRRGYWGVGLYFGDLFFIPFIDVAIGQDELLHLQLSCGATLQLETKRPRSDHPPGSLRITVGVNSDSEGVILFGFGNSEFLSDSYASMSPSRPLGSEIAPPLSIK